MKMIIFPPVCLVVLLIVVVIVSVLSILYFVSIHSNTTTITTKTTITRTDVWAGKQQLELLFSFIRLFVCLPCLNSKCLYICSFYFLRYSFMSDPQSLCKTCARYSISVRFWICHWAQPGSKKLFLPFGIRKIIKKENKFERI